MQGQIPSKDYKTYTKDGAWCWFSDPRAIYHEANFKRSYIGFVTSDGDIRIGYYDHKSGETFEKTIHPNFQADDHVNPSLLFLPDGRLMAFFTGHNGGFYYSKTIKPENISEWEETTKLDLGDRLCYTNPVLLSGEDNRIYVFSRSGFDWKPSFIYSDDFGKTWSQSQSFVHKPDATIDNRPYTKVISDGKNRIWFAITDGHPRDEPLNSIYVFYYEKGKYFEPDGSLIGKMTDMPFDQSKIVKAYDGEQTRVRSWIWDIALDDKGHPVIVYTRLKEETQHRYFYARWDGQKWHHSLVAEGGKDFPRAERTKSQRNPEPHYSGGIIIDHENTDVIYYSAPVGDTFEIFRATLSEGEWAKTQVTQNSRRDNVRPFVVRNSPENVTPRLLWMSNIFYQHYTNYFSRIKMNIKK